MLGVRSACSKVRATTMSVEEWARIETTMVRATRWKTSSAGGGADWEACVKFSSIAVLLHWFRC